MKKEKNELKQMDVNQLKEKAESYRSELFRLRLTSKVGHVKDYSQFKKLRKNLATALTYINEKINQNTIK